MEDKMYQTVVDYIKNEIRADRLRIGNKLPTERELSTNLNLSRNSIREALRTLSSLGMIESRQGSGNYLTGDISRFFTDSFDILTIINRTSPLEISQMRKAIEIEAFHQLLKTGTTEQIDILDQMACQIDAVSADERSIADLNFHLKLIEYCSNSLMFMICTALSSVFLSNVDKSLRTLSEEERIRTHRCHHRLVEALREGNSDMGALAIDTHYSIVNENLNKGLTSN